MSKPWEMEFTITADKTDEVIENVGQKIKAGLTVVGGTVVSRAVLLCPVGNEQSTGIKGYKGGSLRSTIRFELAGDDCVVIKAGGIEGIYKFVNYATFVELGTVKMAAQPYLKPAIEDHLDEYREILVRTITK